MVDGEGCIYAESSTACDYTSPVCSTRFGSASCMDPTMAQWPAPADIGPSNYADNGDGTITDTVTGLIWQKTSGPARVWTGALVYCDGLSLAGHDDWRLPGVVELASIVDYGKVPPGPTINTAVFPDTLPDVYWTVELVPYSPMHGKFVVDFRSGAEGSGDDRDSHFARCVR